MEVIVSPNCMALEQIGILNARQDNLKAGGKLDLKLGHLSANATERYCDIAHS